MVLISMSSIRCSTETDEVGADEPYVLVTTVDRTSSVPVAGFPVPIPTCDVKRYGPFDDVDEHETHAAGFDPFWSGAISRSEDAIFVVSLMENDDGDPEALRGIVKSSAVGSLFGSLALSRSDQVSRLIADVNSAMAVPTGAPNFDDPVGAPQELVFDDADLAAARAGQLVTRTLDISGDGGRYMVRFDASPDVFGAIRDRWIALGAAGSPVGVPLSGEVPTFDGVGRTQPFSAGTISWHPQSGAHAVWGLIGARWSEIGREAFGYPVNDESPAGGGGRFNDFRAFQYPGGPTGSIYWSPATGAHEVYGAIRDRWYSIGGSGGRLGYPLDHEQDADGGRLQHFERGSIFWTAAGGAVVR